MSCSHTQPWECVEHVFDSSKSLALLCVWCCHIKNILKYAQFFFCKHHTFFNVKIRHFSHFNKKNYKYSASRFNSAIVFKCFERNHIDTIQNHARKQLLDLLKSNEESVTCDLHEFYSNFYGNYSHDPANFKFTEEEIALIIKLARHVKILVDAVKDNYGLSHFKSTDNIKDALEIFSGSYYQAQHTATIPRNNVCQSHTHYVLDRLRSIANKNSSRVEAGYRFDDDIKNFAAYIRMLGGRLAYQTVHRNLELALPSLSSIDRYIRQTDDKLIEGELRCAALLEYLKKRELPLIVSLSEDATRIDGRPQYDNKSNQILGFVLSLDQNGMPVPNAFPARNAEEIMKHFSTQKTTNFVTVVMAQPLAESPPFCLLLFASDTKFTAEIVVKRWDFISNELKKLNIEVLTISTDSDPRSVYIHIIEFSYPGIFYFYRNFFLLSLDIIVL